ncbi:2-C-methyl-D-erythritol 4-phosphate cytidylyltransferase [Pedobacter sp. Bi27]|uniref:2-C-methyl-D-erythritol 4-phosphate cytidylyltransferase n=1 Tax=unclassified Pedobacter TaxID=2628915 RepID=UPI001E0D0E56|nr:MULTISPECIES: 2-C-methyl-D-erythritol 4-phosphate cytidylyltransferase [unclassified Pedobacter]CAH0131773.1 2-C-methyl-D-erythritol 4-phosphate cytidylyltransferase [Pedobacter sp. Bi36]CAH0187262.1 2-C-methyl-D-erythritol 4-phosphate cytidylyltransferase [Pedobacter sp. Bi126]CAH0246497.1 2-C-methyl-D-erythritol 4-phosphate cytidylyltransferase [Pedobacter sp. Bi27]
MKYYAIIVAGGSGNRMQTETPKQFLLLKNLPVLMHTIKAFAQSDTQPKILLVLNKDQQAYWTRLCEEFNFHVPHQVIDGGTERFHSVKNAIHAIEEESYVAIHDAVRPLVSKSLIDNCFNEAELQGNVIAAVQSSDSVRSLRDGKTTALKRDEIYLVQTPQTFSLNILKEAYNQEFNTHFTDDASVVESIGYEINIIEGERGNIKITYPIDLELAELLLKN